MIFQLVLTLQQKNQMNLWLTHTVIFTTFQQLVLDFFTIYGPIGRPDMAYFKFTKAILEGKPIDVYNEGNQSRDYTYIDDLIRAIMALLEKTPGNIEGTITGSKKHLLKFTI